MADPTVLAEIEALRARRRAEHEAWKERRVAQGYPEWEVYSREIREAHERHVEALIEIATGGFVGLDECDYCGTGYELPCRKWCPGLLARRALGVA